MDRRLTRAEIHCDTMAANPARYMKLITPNIPQWDPYLYKFIQAANGMRDWDAYWERFEVEVGLWDILANAGLQMRNKEEHRLVEAWPKRCKKGGSQEEFDLKVAKFSTGFERYVELMRKA